MASKDGVVPGNGDESVNSSLNELLQSSRNLPRRSNEIGTIHLGLGDIQKKAYKMRKYNKTGKDTNPYTKAHYLLIGKGITIEEIQGELDSIDLHQLDTSSIVGGNTVLAVSYKDNKHGFADIEGYVTTQQHESILTAIEQSLSSSARDFDHYVNQNISTDWKQQNEEMRSRLTTMLKREQSDSAPSSPEKRKRSPEKIAEKPLSWGLKPSRSILSPRFKFEDVKAEPDPESIVNPNASYALRRKFELYAQVIYELNDAREKNAPYQLCTVFADLSKREMTTRSRQLHETWVILRDFCELDGSTQERKFAQAHCSESLTDPNSIQLRKRITTKSRAYLESQFLDHVNESYQKLEKATSPDDLVSNTTKIAKSVELALKNKSGEWKVANLTFVNGTPIWAMVFYLLRAGCYEEAIKFVSENDDSFQKLERSFPLYLKAYCESPENTLPPELQGRITNEFNQYFKHSTNEADPYRFAVYKIVGRCDLAHRGLPSITLSVEDWIWVHLSLVKEDSSTDDLSSVIHERYSLTELQKEVLDYGADAFSGSSNNPMYLQTLIFVGLYESAVHYLFNLSEIDAVHLAVGLAYYGLLNVPDEAADESTITKLLSVDAKGFQAINFARLIGYYTRTFKYSDPRVASEYLFEICLCEGLPETKKKQQIALGHSAIRELVLETREFVMLLGRIDKDGTRIPGIIEQRKKLLYLDDEESYLHKIAEKAAHQAEEEGRPYDCILLYQLSEEYDTVLNMVNRLLGDFLASVDFRTPLTDVINADTIKGDTNIVKLARRLMKTYNSSPEVLTKTPLKLRETCTKLLELVDIETDFTSTHPNLDAILQRIKALDIVPCAASIDLDKVRAKAQEFNTLDEDVAKNVPNMLVMEMSCISQLVYELQQGYEIVQLEPNQTSNQTKEQRLAELKRVSSNCMVYVGMVHYKMPREVYRTLVNLEVDI